MTHDCYISPDAIGSDGHPPIRLSRHSVSRFRERVASSISMPAGHLSLIKTIERQGCLTLTRPEWVSFKPENPAAAFLLLGDEVVLPLCRDRYSLVAVTTLTRFNSWHRAEPGRRISTYRPAEGEGSVR